MSIENINVKNSKLLINPDIAKHNYPLPTHLKQKIIQNRQIIQDILDNKINKLIVIVGPCSIHDPNIAIDYAKYLVKEQQKYPNLHIIMRTYFSKPRTTIGWKGFIYDPDLNNTYKINKGILKARKLLLDLLEMGVFCSMEHLDMILPQYFCDLLSWAAIGARTSESQIHRELASGLSTPVGFKNGTNGNIDIAINAIKSSNHEHNFIGCDLNGNICKIHTNGNKYSHIILRGGGGKTNYDEESVKHTITKLQSNNVRDIIFIDFSHGNSNKFLKNKSINITEYTFRRQV